MSSGPTVASAARAERFSQRGSRGWGAVVLLLLTLGTLVLFSYTLLDLPWQQRLGGWNYVAALVLVAGSGLPLRRWRPDPRYPVNASSITG